ncbi:hypothetical protein [Qipengyuania citrea]|jgi:hypothetical protein|uniref:hypothetical protein n=1 Tax=Qipengyuania citrea TaxID=225971 RepID=UPI0026D6B0F3
MARSKGPSSGNRYISRMGAQLKRSAFQTRAKAVSEYSAMASGSLRLKKLTSAFAAE